MNTSPENSSRAWTSSALPQENGGGRRRHDQELAALRRRVQDLEAVVAGLDRFASQTHYEVFEIRLWMFVGFGLGAISFLCILQHLGWL